MVATGDVQDFESLLTHCISPIFYIYHLLVSIVLYSVGSGSVGFGEVTSPPQLFQLPFPPWTKCRFSWFCNMGDWKQSGWSACPAAHWTARPSHWSASPHTRHLAVARHLLFGRVLFENSLG
jgi:hypothetical protein